MAAICEIMTPKPFGSWDMPIVSVLPPAAGAAAVGAAAAGAAGAGTVGAATVAAAGFAAAAAVGAALVVGCGAAVGAVGTADGPHAVAKTSRATPNTTSETGAVLS